MRVDDRARVTYAAVTQAVRKVSGARQHFRQSLTTRKSLVNYLLGLWGYVMRTRRLDARLSVFVSNYQWHGRSDITMFVDDAPLKKAHASWPFCRGSRQPATPAVRKISGARQHHATIADNAKTLG
jgi:hypothetical protein